MTLEHMILYIAEDKLFGVIIFTPVVIRCSLYSYTIMKLINNSSIVSINSV